MFTFASGNECLNHPMNRFIIYYLNLSMLFTTAASAQKKQADIIRWKIAAMLPAMNGQPQSKGFAGPVSGVNHDMLIVGGGSNFPDSMPWFGGKKKYYDDGYALKKATDGNLQFFKLFKLPYTIAYAASCSTPRGIVYAGGENEKGIQSQVMLLQWDTNTEGPVFKQLPDLPQPVTNAAITCFEFKLYILGGETAHEVSRHLYCLNLNDIKVGWQKLPDAPELVSHAVIAVQSYDDQSFLYLMGGRNKKPNGISDLYSAVYRFHLKDHTWEKKRSLPYALSAGTGVAYGSQYILLFGGDKGTVFHKTENLIAAINREKEGRQKNDLNLAKIQLQSTHPGFSKEVLQYDITKDLWSVAGYIPLDVPVTTTAVIWGDRVIISNGEIRAGVRTPQILAGKLKITETGIQ